MSHEEPSIRDTPAQSTAVQAQETPSYEPIEEEGEWPDEPAELPRRPRRRLLTPVPLALLAVLLIACGFIAGVVVEKGQGSSGSSSGAAASRASRFSALGGGTAGAGTRTGATSNGGASGGSPGSGTAGGGPVSGQVAYMTGSTLYVTTAEGNTVKVTTSAATSVTKTVKTASVKGVHPGETVTITGHLAAPTARSAPNRSGRRERRRPGGPVRRLRLRLRHGRKAERPHEWRRRTGPIRERPLRWRAVGT